MRVLTVGNMYPPHHLGGYELMWRSWVLHMRARGHEVRVLTTDYRAEAPDAAIPEDPDARRELRWYWRDHEIPRLPLRERLAIERHNAAVLERHLAELRPEALSWWAMGGMSLSLLERVRRAGLPASGVVVDEWMGYAPRMDGWQRLFGRRAIGPATTALTGIPAPVSIARAARWLFVSAYVRERALAGGIGVAAAEVVHAGIDLGQFAPAGEREWEGRLLCLGRIDPRKGLATAVRALARLPECRLRIVGTGDARHTSELRALADELGVSGRLCFEEVPRDGVRDAYADADAFLFPVLWPEPFGLVPLEAMAVGRPVLATGTGGSGEYLRAGENCLLSAPGDERALAAAVQRLAADPGLRARLRRGGFATAAAHDEQRFNEAVARATTEVAASGERRRG
jgi:glycosyltransferase involved in cell wall biosynthesis